MFVILFSSMKNFVNSLFYFLILPNRGVSSRLDAKPENHLILFEILNKYHYEQLMKYTFLLANNFVPIWQLFS